MPDLPFADAKVHSELAAARIGRSSFVDRLVKRGIRFSVSVTGGALDGISAEKYCRTCVVGTDPQADIVLFDEGISPQHVEFVFKSSVFGPVVSVHALGPQVSVNNETVVAGKATPYLALPQSVKVQGVTLEFRPHFTEPKEPNVFVTNAWRYGRRPAIAIVAVLLAIRLLDHGSFDFEVALNPSKTPYVPVPRQREQTVELELVTTSVQDKLTELGLNEFLSVALHQSGAIEMNGTLRSDKEAAWKEFHQWYDESNSSVLLSHVTKAPDLSELPAISSIKLTEPRKVNLLNGEQLGIGDAINQNVRLKAINAQTIVLDAQGEDITVSFTEGGLRHGETSK